MELSERRVTVAPDPGLHLDIKSFIGVYSLPAASSVVPGGPAGF